MHFIGIIANDCDFEFVKNEITKKINRSQFELLNINSENIDFIKNVKFDLIVIDLDLNGINKKILNQILTSTKYIMLNADIEINLEDFNKINAKVITYGLNQKSTLTLSSVDNEEILICLQRSMQTIDNQVIEPNETYIKNNTENVYNIFIMFGILLIFKGKM